MLPGGGGGVFVFIYTIYDVYLLYIYVLNIHASVQRIYPTFILTILIYMNAWVDYFDFYFHR